MNRTCRTMGAASRITSLTCIVVGAALRGRPFRPCMLHFRRGGHGGPPLQRILLGLFFVCIVASSAMAQQAIVPSAAEKYFSDVELINQDGEKLRFYSDVLKNKVVIINAFFTTCRIVEDVINDR